MQCRNHLIQLEDLGSWFQEFKEVVSGDKVLKGPSIIVLGRTTPSSWRHKQ